MGFISKCIILGALSDNNSQHVETKGTVETQQQEVREKEEMAGIGGLELYCAIVGAILTAKLIVAILSGTHSR